MGSRQDSKRAFVNSFGGKCEICGYDVCIQALVFHHLDPKEKEFNISRYVGNKRVTYELLRELSRVCLLCCRCHAEVHAGLHDERMKDVIPKDIEEFLDLGENDDENL
jgi:hypothetical protein